MRVYKFNVYSANSTSGNAPYTRVLIDGVPEKLGVYYWYVQLDTGLYQAMSNSETRPTPPVDDSYFVGKVDAPEYLGGDYILPTPYTITDLTRARLFQQTFPYVGIGHYYREPTTSPTYDTLWFETTDALGNKIVLLSKSLYLQGSGAYTCFFAEISIDNGQTTQRFFYLYNSLPGHLQWMQNHFFGGNIASAFAGTGVDSFDNTQYIYQYYIGLNSQSTAYASHLVGAFRYEVNTGILYFLNSATVYAEGEDPYEGKGTTRPSEPDPHDREDDDKDFPQTPTSYAMNSGFITTFTPTEAQLKSFATYLWGNGFDLDDFKRIFANPMEAILGLSIIPINPVSSIRNANVIIGNISTGVRMDVVTSQFVQLACGTVAIEEFWGSYLDYAPFTTVEIYLPYIGIKRLDTNEVMKKTIDLRYTIDALSGQCVANIKVGNKVLYSFTGSCSAQVPITSQNYDNMLSLSVSTSVATVGAGVAAATGVATGGISTAAAVASALSAGASGIANAASASKQHIDKSGSLSGMAGFLAPQTPYIILTYPNQALPSNQNSFTGYPSLMTVSLGTLTGFTVVRDIHFNSTGNATKHEIDEIVSLLKQGVIL